MNQWGRRHPNRKVAKAKTVADLEKIVKNNIKWEPVSDIKPVENAQGTLLYYAQLLQLKQR